MATRNRAFLIAFRALVASLALFSLLMLMLQAFPQLRSRARFAAASLIYKSPTTPEEGSEAIADETEENSLDPFSGSVSGGEVLIDEPGSTATTSTNDSYAANTVNMDEAARQPSDGKPTVDPRTVPKVSSAVVLAALDRWEARLSSLERHWAELENGQAQSEDRERLIETLQHCELQSAQLKTTQDRLALIEQQFQALQESLPAARSDNEPEAETNGSSAIESQRIRIHSEKKEGQTRLIVEARDASLSELFARLGEAAGVNILVAPSITGSVSLHLQVSTPLEAIKTVCRTYHCRHAQEGDALVISRDETAAKGTAAEKPLETMTKLYRLKHVTGPEIGPYVSVMLTPGVGKISIANLREREASPSHGDLPRAVLVKDTPTVLSAVDRLMEELDQPSATTARPISTESASPTLPAPQPPQQQAQPQPQMVQPAASCSGSGKSASVSPPPAPPCVDCGPHDPPVIGTGTARRFR